MCSFVIINCYGLPIIGPLTGQLSSKVEGLGNPVPMGIDLICNKARFTSLLLSRQFLIVYFTNCIHISTCPLLHWYYDDLMASSIVICL